jgi:hypothetical protein
VKLLYVTPELVATSGFAVKLTKLHNKGLIGLVAIDEVRLGIFSIFIFVLLSGCLLLIYLSILHLRLFVAYLPLYIAS